jgi:hypothetical protein
MLAMDFLQRLFPLACCLLLMCCSGYSEEPTATTLSGCRAPDFDVNFQLINGPSEKFTVAFEMRNITGRACILDRGSYGTNGSPTFPDRTKPWGKVFVLASDSNARVWGNEGVVGPTAAVLQPGKSAYFRIGWKTKPMVKDDPCIQPIAVNWPVLIVAPSLFKPLCSEIEVSSFAQDEDEIGQSSNFQMLSLASEKSTYYEGEKPLLHASLYGADADGSVSKDTRPTVYVRQRASDGTTEFRATGPLPRRGCAEPGSGTGSSEHAVITAPVFEEIDWKKGFDLDPDFCGSVVRPKRRGGYSFQVFKATTSSNTAIRFVNSNVLFIEFEDVSPLNLNSGPKSNVF